MSRRDPQAYARADDDDRNERRVDSARLARREVPREIGRLSVSFPKTVRNAADFRRKTLLAFGSVCFLLAVVVAVLPSAYVPGVVTRFGAVLEANRGPVLLFGVLAGLFGAWSLYRRESPPAEAVSFPERAPESAYYDERETVGADVDRAVDGDEDVEGWRRRRYRRRARERLYYAALTTLRDADGLSERVARSRLADGSWTDRRRAAVFLGDDVPPLSLGTRIRDWASGEGFARQVRDTVAAVEALADGDRPRDNRLFVDAHFDDESASAESVSAAADQAAGVNGADAADEHADDETADRTEAETALSDGGSETVHVEGDADAPAFPFFGFVEGGYYGVHTTAVERAVDETNHAVDAADCGGDATDRPERGESR